MYNSPAEKELVEDVWPQSRRIASDIAGVGIEPAEFPPSESPLSQPYFIYIGRIDRSKNVHELEEWFARYREGRDIKLVLVGKAEEDWPAPGPGVIRTGFVSDEEKNRWLAHAQGLIIPSKHESLSLVTLEAMQAGIPVIARGDSKVLEDHIRLSRAGRSYRTEEEFRRALDDILRLSPREREDMAARGRRYVAERYRWDRIIDKFERAFELILNEGAPSDPA
ncbi:MAG: glycosyltransferase family 4 protein [Chlorobi bacterium]|nr:glycosyltransferase family 4 protein [Chlorobiota bacterium]